MVDESHRALHQFITERAGDTYRTAFYYDERGWETIYVREDIATNQLQETVPKAVERARNTRSFLRAEEYPPLGATAATTEVHENGVILHFPEGKSAGVLISLDRDAAHRLATFIDQAVAILSSTEARYETTATD